MATRLVPISPGSAPPINVQRPVVLLGRHPECDVRIDLPKISRRHCCVALAYDRVVIRDLGSRNGVRVNGAVVDEAELHPGDMVALGPLLFRVEDPEAGVRPAVATNRGRPADAPAPAPAAPAPAPTPADADKPPSLPFLPLDPEDPDGDLIPIDIDF